MHAQDKMNQAVETFAKSLLEMVFEKLTGSLPARRNGAKNGGHRHHLDMNCRVPGCKNRSRGPRFLFLCLDHKSISKPEAQKLLKEYREKAT